MTNIIVYNLKPYLRSQRLKKRRLYRSNSFEFLTSGHDLNHDPDEMALGDLDYMVGIWKMLFLGGMSL